MANAVLHSISPLLSNPGCASWTLFLDKLGFERQGGTEAKTATLTKAKSIYGKQKDRLRETLPCQRWLSAFARQHGNRYRCVTLVNQSPLLLHLGRASVLENVGIYTDRATGLPTIPGSAIKGVLSTWATWEANQLEDGSFPAAGWQLSRRDFPADHADRILGCNSGSGSEHAGEIVFVGAYPKTVPVLGLDIVNPHRDTNGQDLRRLTPNVFLCIEPGTQWDFVFYTKVGAAGSKALLDATEMWLKDALAQSGVGSKTAAGYGRFVPVGKLGNPVAGPLVGPAVAVPSKGDYPDDRTFKARVVEKLAPNRLHELQKEIPVLQKLENAQALAKLKQWIAGTEGREIRKRLREKDWFPKEWLPTP
ncbi:MAG: type III-B CRISPR module RAMP protein Cmr6 [Verrucomicrobia bacterium]|nr:type III-B CRISPR module RAMP protein Cmr6 [Verrucomicrobiota bacterium]